jgi:hypothetical protein
LANSALGAIPVVGALCADIIQNIIPNQRMDRIVRFIKKPDEKIRDIKANEFENHFKNEKFIDLGSHMQSSTDEFDRQALHSTYKAHLEKLQLIKARFKTTGSGKLPEFDEKTGMIKISSYQITWLGRILLLFIGLDNGWNESKA